MSGHSKWSKVKHQKALTDAKKSQAFSKISRLVSIAAKKGGDPEMNPGLKYAIGQAKSANMPSDKIERAIKKGAGEMEGERLEEVVYEAFGPEGSALLITGITDNKNRTTGQIKHLLSDLGAKMGEPGTAAWAFERLPDKTWKAKNLINTSTEGKEKIKKLIEELEQHEDLQSIYTNVNL
ncbi:YebC/PmpR family DNA-binding transcriptional regulator [Patescibacteria group bacterium]|nr:YebC/PmpR family DNA-binding transcriptional regulator [Patescibacteria group bacterium]